MFIIKDLDIKTTSLINYNDEQRVDISCHINKDAHLLLRILNGDTVILENIPVHFISGKSLCSILIPACESDIETLWQICDKDGTVISQKQVLWKKPREWEMYVMVSSHTDIGLHNSQYIQRHNSVEFAKKAMELCDSTAERDENDRYRYVMEGTWFFENYEKTMGEEKTKELVENYIKTGKMGVCAGIAGNHTQTFGLEEMCRATYGRHRLKKKYGLDIKTMTMIDNNGISWAMVQPFADAGYENIIFAPNQWNPLPSTIWKKNTKVASSYTARAYTWNPDAAGGGSRIDIRYTSELPMLFYWQGADENKKMLVWGSTQYDFGGQSFGLSTDIEPLRICEVEDCMADQLELMESKVPYDVWFFACYNDDQSPDTRLTDTIAEWNKCWKYPKLRTMGNPDEPFELVKQRFGDKIPVVCGDITGGWYQHPITAPEILAAKFEADRLLPTAEKLAVIAAMTDKNYKYPKISFERAWEALLLNDEHSYGTSGYQGRRVYETWMQHRDWIAKAYNTAQTESERALKIIADMVYCKEPSVLVFNPTLKTRSEYVSYQGKNCYVADIPPFGYKTVKLSEFVLECSEEKTTNPPVVENKYYKIEFAPNGAIASIYDKELGRELLDLDNEFKCNEFVYTNDNHKTFIVPETADFKIIRESDKITVVSKTDDKVSGAEIIQKVSLIETEKRIDIDNTLNHVSDLFNNNRYYRYCYYAFPFMVENAKRYCHLNGCVAQYAKSITGHGTDVYMASNEWCCSENEKYGVAILQLDSELVEFDHIHPDKTDYGQTGEGSQIFSYIACDWLQMHLAGGSHNNFHFRYSIVSYSGGYRENSICDIAERYSNPVVVTEIGANSGKLPDSHSFMKADDCRLLTLKRAEDGDGVIARFYTGGEYKNSMPEIDFFDCSYQRVSTDETPLVSDDALINGFITYRIGKGKINISVESEIEITENPAQIGLVYTGLITKPVAARGEDSGHLYLLWGANTEEDFSHYELYRGEESGFVPCDKTFVANVEPEQYVVGRYVDKGLKEHTKYYYRVRAVNKSGKKGSFSDEFCGITKETI